MAASCNISPSLSGLNLSKKSQSLGFNPLNHVTISNLHKNGCPFASNPLHHVQICHRSASKNRSRSNMDFAVYATPEAEAAATAAGSFLPFNPSSLFSFLPTDNPWIGGIAALLVAGPLLTQRLIALSKEVDMAAQMVEKVADTVGNVAKEIDKAADEITESLPEGGLKKMVQFVDTIAEETVKDAQMIEDLMDKVEELDDKLEAYLDKQSKPAAKLPNEQN